MLCKDLKVVNLNITEDFYQYKALFRLCSENACMDIDMEMLSDPLILTEIIRTFEIEENTEVLKSEVTQKILEASKLESRIKEGQDYGRDVEDKKIQRNIDSLSTS
ncbi:MAG: hypothetical protein N2484_12425 [Clostridia bacterium]|nr:hypothetical protein [Clostridia bacterium]